MLLGNISHINKQKFLRNHLHDIFNDSSNQVRVSQKHR